MGIKGSFREIKFAEVLKIIDDQTGRLWIYNLNANSYDEWTFHQKAARSVRAGGRSLTARDEIFQAALRLGEDNSSSYIFYPLSFESLTSEISVPLSDIIVAALNNSFQTDDYEAHLPHRDTRFALIKNAPLNLVGELKDFWNLYSQHLSDGFTAAVIAGQCGLQIDEVRLVFYKLRVAGIIQPLRLTGGKKAPAPIETSIAAGHIQPSSPALAANDANQVRQNIAPQATPERKSLIRLMLNAIKLKK